jgi:hypothetical protein
MHAFQRWMGETFQTGPRCFSDCSYLSDCSSLVRSAPRTGDWSDWHEVLLRLVNTNLSRVPLLTITPVPEGGLQHDRADNLTVHTIWKASWQTMTTGVDIRPQLEGVRDKPGILTSWRWYNKYDVVPSVVKSSNAQEISLLCHCSGDRSAKPL